MNPWSDFPQLVNGLARIHHEAEQAVSRSVDEIFTLRNWLIGAWIIAYEQEGVDRARYGARVLESLAEAFKQQGIKGLSISNLKNYRQIALTWPRLGIRQTLSGESVPMLPAPEGSMLIWQDEAWMKRLRTTIGFSVLLELSRIDHPLQRAFYEIQCLKENWSVRELKRQRNAMLFERVGLSKDREAVLALVEKGHIPETPSMILKDPYILEFLGMEGKHPKTEEDLESALIAHLEDFLLELGRDFCFIGRQYRITVGGRHHFIDLLFFHRRLRCLVAIDLKLGMFGYEDAGQMNFYLNFLKENVALPDENPPIGLILCADKDTAEVHYATGSLDQKVVVSRYMVELPAVEQLQKWLLEEQEILSRILQTPAKSESKNGN